MSGDGMKKQTSKSLLGVMGLMSILTGGQQAASDEPAKGKSRSSGVVVERDIPYGSHPLQRFDLHRPPRTGPCPVLVIVHGGGWVKGDKRIFSHIADLFASLGLVVLNVNYRLAPKHRFPVMIDDVACALQWVEAEGVRYGADPSRVVLLGQSAGAHIVSLIGLTPDRSWGRVCPWQGFLEVDGVVALAGIFDFEKAHKGMRYRLDQLLPPGEERRRFWNEAQPIKHVRSRADTSFLLLHGKRDSFVPADRSRDFYHALRTAGMRAHLKFFRLRGHLNLFLGIRKKDPVAVTIEGFLRKLWPGPWGEDGGGTSE